DIDDIDVFNDFGLVSIRNENYKLLLFNTNIGQAGKGGHNHNDLLSLCLSYNGREFIIDPGVFLYSVDRDKQRSITKHSSLFACLNGEALEPELFLNRFGVSNQTKKRVLRRNQDIEASYSLPTSFDDLTLCRTINYSLNEIVITDSLLIERGFISGLQLRSNLFFSDTVVAKKISNNEVLLCNGIERVLLIFDSSCTIEISYSSISSDYNKFATSQFLNVSTNEREFKWSIKLI
ncbi:hypothetical protein CWB63_03585, partial [Pseudoalteromonas sp. S409]